MSSTLLLRRNLAAVMAAIFLSGCVGPATGDTDHLWRVRCEGYEDAAAAQSDSRLHAHFMEAAQRCWGNYASMRGKGTPARDTTTTVIIYGPPAVSAGAVGRPPNGPAGVAMPSWGDYRTQPPATWGQTPFDVPPIMRDVPVQQFPWLAH